MRAEQIGHEISAIRITEETHGQYANQAAADE
jgi:hypothetical protein